MISGNLNADTEQLYLDSGVIKVADFGLSKTLTQLEDHKRNQVLDPNLTTFKMTGETGSYRYMAPEVFRHEPYNLKVDVYSYAMIVFQLFECICPFHSTDPIVAARNAAMTGKRPEFPTKDSLSEADAALRRLVVDCWDGDPEKRPAFVEIIARLEELLKKMPKHEIFKGGNAGECGCILQ